MDKMTGKVIIEMTNEGRVNVSLDGLPLDKVLLYGLLEVGKEAVKQIVEDSKRKIQLPGPMRILPTNGS